MNDQDDTTTLDPDLSAKLYISGHYLMATYKSRVKAIALLTDEDLKTLTDRGLSR